MMRIAVAGGGGLGYMLATELAQAANAYNVIVLSRARRPEFQSFDVQVHVVDYTDHDSLAYSLQGIDLVLSTVSGPEQLNLINAAAQSCVRLFVPSEFEGSLGHRPRDDPLDRGSKQALTLLQRWAQASRMRFTVFSCGLFMERFHPYGLGSLGIGFGQGVSGVGDYLLDINSATAEYPDRNAKGHGFRVCLTSVYDVVRFVVAAVDLGPANWPNELTMRGDRMSLQDLVGACSIMRNVSFEQQTRQHGELQAYLTYYSQTGDLVRLAYYQRLLETANGRYDYSRATLNEMVDSSEYVDVQPLTFGQWLASIWQPS